MNKLVIPILLVIIFSLFSTQSFVNAEVKVTPPSNWQTGPGSNSTHMAWFQNSTKSLFVIFKSPFKIPLIFLGPLVAQSLVNRGEFESADQLSFGHNNSGYRYFANRNPSPSNMSSSPSDPIQNPLSYDEPFKAMLILTEKQGDLYVIALFSPKQNFDSVYNQIKPSLDSIELSNSTALVN